MKPPLEVTIFGHQLDASVIARFPEQQALKGTLQLASCLRWHLNGPFSFLYTDECELNLTTAFSFRVLFILWIFLVSHIKSTRSMCTSGLWQELSSCWMLQTLCDRSRTLQSEYPSISLQYRRASVETIDSDYRVVLSAEAMNRLLLFLKFACFLCCRQLYDLLSHPVFCNNHLPLLLACNKADLGAKAHTDAFIVKLLEKEM